MNPAGGGSYGPALETWGHLRIMGKLGAGGFGEVHRAWDETLEREVALKLLHREIGRQSSLKSEGRLLAKLRHPNIMTVYGLAEHNGRIGMWSELIQGRTLAELVQQQGRFGAAEAAAIGREICRALAAAHGSGLLHRDIKAQNVMREDGGRIVLMDFGLGIKTGPASEDEVQHASGTPPYMAPELFSGQPASAESDIYAAGVLLFYLVTGAYPVEARNWHDFGEAHRTGRRRLLADLRPDLPQAYVDAITKALAPIPADRFQTAGELLRALAEQPSAHEAASPPTRTYSRRYWTGALLAAGAALVGLARFIPESSRPAWFGARKASIAVLPFSNLSAEADNEYLAAGIAEELVNELAKSDSLRVVARASTAGFKGGARDFARIAGQLGVDSMLTGGVQRDGDRVRVSVQLVRAADSTQIWSESYVYQWKDVFAIQQQISRAVAGVLQVKLSATPAAAEVGSEAYNLFLQGRFFQSKGNPINIAKAIEYYQAALEQDPNYARAFAGLARAYTAVAWQNVPSPDIVAQARNAANRAIRLDGRLAEAHVSLGYVKELYDWDWAGAEEEFRLAIDCNPKSMDARLFYAGLLMNQGRTAESWTQLDHAAELDPLSPDLPRFRAVLMFYEKRYAEGEREIQKTLANSPEHPAGNTCLGILSFGLGKNEQALSAFRRAFDFSKSPSAKATYGWALGRAGHRAEARDLLRELEADARKDQASPAQVAIVAGGAGELDTGFRWLEEAVRVHDPALVQGKIAPTFGELRQDPRFDRILERVGLNTSR